MKLRRTTWALAGALLATLAFPASGMAVTGTVTEFPVKTLDGKPFGITTGPDGNVWFTEQNAKKVGRITPSGTVTETDIPGATTPYQITAGPAGDNHLWISDQGSNNVYRVDPATNPPTITAFTPVTVNTAKGIAAGPDGNIWTANGNGTIGRVNTAGAAVGAQIPIPGSPNLQEIAKGPDGNMWVAEFLSPPAKVARITTGASPVVTEFSTLTGGALRGIVAGPDGKVYFTDTDKQRIGHINTDGTGVDYTTPTLTPSSDPEGLAVGQDGNVWVAIFNDSQIGRVTPSLGLAQFKTGIGSLDGPRFITRGADGNMWFSLEGEPMSLTPHGAIGRITVDAPTPPPTPPPSGGGGGGGGGGGAGGATNGTTPTTPVNNAGTPQVSQVAVRPSRFRVGARATAVSAAAKTGTTITFVLTKDARATLSIDQAVQGRRRGSGCVRINRRNINGRKCTRFIPRGTLTRTAVQGLNTVPFTGRIGRRALKPGRYRLGVEGTDAEGRTGLFDYATFVVLPPKQKTTRRGR